MCIKKGRDISLLFLGEEASFHPASRTSYWGSTVLYAFSSLWMHVFCSYSCAVNRKIVPKATTCVFLGYAQSGYRCYDVKSKRLDVSLMLSLMEMESPHIFLNLINQPRGRMMMEMYCGLLLFINFFLILLQLMLRISLTLQASSFAQHFLPIVSLFS